MPKFSHFDLEVTGIYNGKHIKLAFEIKERNKSESQLEAYPNSELKVDKLNLVFNSTKGYNGVYYIQLINEDFAYIYDLRNLNWDNVVTKEWFIKTV